MFTMRTVIMWIIAIMVLLLIIFITMSALPYIAGVGSNLPWGFFR